MAAIGETIAVCKSTDQSVTSNTSLQNDSELLWTVQAGEVWVFTQTGGWTCTTVCGFKWAFNHTGGATITGRHTGTSTLGAASNLNLTSSHGANSGALDSLAQTITGIVDNTAGGNGTVNFQFAQNTSSGAVSAVTKGTTVLIATRIA